MFDLNTTFLPLGSHCRTSFQIRQFCEKSKNLHVKSNPFDWTISTFNCLQVILDKNFNPHQILRPGSLSLSKYDSIVCSYTGLIFHHDLHISSFPEYPEKDCIDWNVIGSHEKFEMARGRFFHTYQNLMKDIQSPNLIVVRRLQAPTFSKAEDEDMLFKLISNHRNNTDFKLIYLHTEKSDEEPQVENFMEEIKTSNSNIIKCRLRERPGYDGDGTKNFRGDTRSWELLLDYALSHFGLTM